jgi:hypothetical protein
MARERKEITDLIKAEIRQKIPALNSTSVAAIYNLIADIVGYAIWLHESLWDIAKEEIQTAKDTAIVQTAPWYADKMKGFQYQPGVTESLIVDPVTYQVRYDPVDESKQIIDRVAVTGLGAMIVKVAKASGALTSDEKVAAEAYLRAIQSPGMQISLISEPADLLSLTGTIHYNAEAGLADIQTAVETAINQFLTGLPFNGELQKNALIDSVRKLESVSDVDFTSVQVRPDVGTYENIGRVYFPFSGYIEVDNLNLNYEPVFA